MEKWITTEHGRNLAISGNWLMLGDMSADPGWQSPARLLNILNDQLNGMAGTLTGELR